MWDWVKVLFELLSKQAPVVCFITSAILIFPDKCAPEGVVKLREEFSLIIDSLWFIASCVVVFQIGSLAFNWGVSEIRAKRETVNKRLQDELMFKSRLDREEQRFNRLAPNERELLIKHYEARRPTFSVSRDSVAAGKLIDRRFLIETGLRSPGFHETFDVTLSDDLMELFENRLDRVKKKFDEDRSVAGRTELW